MNKKSYIQITIICFLENIFTESMFKIDQIKHLFDCCQCNLLLVDPVALPCGYNVCKQHIDELLDNSNNKLKCQFCPRDHPIPEWLYSQQTNTKGVGHQAKYFEVKSCL